MTEFAVFSLFFFVGVVIWGTYEENKKAKKNLVHIESMMALQKKQNHDIDLLRNEIINTDTQFKKIIDFVQSKSFDTEKIVKDIDWLKMKTENQRPPPLPPNILSQLLVTEKPLKVIILHKFKDQTKSHIISKIKSQLQGLS